MLAGGLLLFLVLIGLSAMWSARPDYRVLFSNLNDKDGGAIVAQLTKMNVPYRFSEGGGAVLVPADQVHDVRLKLAQSGLPKGSTVGFELMDNARFGTTQFQERLNFQRGLEGELVRSITALSAVESARVHLALPNQNGFFPRPAEAQRLGAADPAWRPDARPRADRRHRAPGVGQRAGAEPEGSERARPDWRDALGQRRWRRGWARLQPGAADRAHRGALYQAHPRYPGACGRPRQPARAGVGRAGLLAVGVDHRRIQAQPGRCARGGAQLAALGERQWLGRRCAGQRRAGCGHQPAAGCGLRADQWCGAIHAGLTDRAGRAGRGWPA